MPSFSLSSGHSINLNLDVAWIEACKRAPRSFVYSGSRPSDWELQYYRMFLEHASTRALGTHVATVLVRASLVGDAAAEALIDLVQTGIAYDFARASSPMTDGLQYPVETLDRRAGVCADKSLLLAAMLATCGYGVCLFAFDKANHMAVGIEAPAGAGSFGTPFVYVETTDQREVGVVPATMTGGVKLDGKPKVIALQRGRAYLKALALKQQQDEAVKQFGKDFVQMNPIQQELKRKMVDLNAKMDAFKPQLKNCSGKELPFEEYKRCQALNAQFNEMVAEYNALVAAFNAANRP